MKTKNKRLVPFFTWNALVHHSDHVNECDKPYASSTDNMEAITCKSCLSKLKTKNK